MSNPVCLILSDVIYERFGNVRDRNRNARTIIPLTVAVWLLAILGVQLGAPPGFWPVFGIAFAVAVVWVVFSLMAGQGWSILARRYRSQSSFPGDWQFWPTAQMSLASVDDPEFNKHRLRMVSTLRTGATTDALHLSLLFSRVPILSRFFPDVRIPWTEFSSARTFDAPGWFAPPQEPGAVRVGFDPNYRGAFVELQAGEPSVFIQLPFAALGEGAVQLGLGDLR